MTIKQQGGIFGRNPTFNDVEAKDITSETLVVNSNSSDAGFFEATGGYALAAFQDASSANHTSLELRSDGGSASNSRYLIRGYGNYSSSPTETYYVTSGGYQYLANNLIFASGSGIDFSATSGTGTSELFSDYEEGTWTPEYLGSAGDPTVTYDVQSGKYTKIGNVVFARFELGTDVVSGGSGDLRIGGLPYSCSGENSGKLGLAYNFGTSLGEAIYYISSSQTYFTINTTANSSAKAPVTSLASTANTNRMFAHVVYMTS